jgi:hypothetical protein
MGNEPTLLSLDEGAELKRLYADLSHASRRATAILRTRQLGNIRRDPPRLVFGEYLEDPAASLSCRRPNEDGLRIENDAYADCNRK